MEKLKIDYIISHEKYKNLTHIFLDKAIKIRNSRFLP